jgi:hypothetical protein
MEIDLDDILHTARKHDLPLEMNSNHSRSTSMIGTYVGNMN